MKLPSAWSGRPPQLHTVSDTKPGITRTARGNTFTYRDARGRILRDNSELKRIAALAIPPAWTDVWICPDPDGHIQATGRDARGRKQYRYHPGWTLRREATKTSRLLGLASSLPVIRRRVRRDLTRRGMPREKVLALMVRLLELTAVRPGHREYARQNGSIGLASMQDSHARVKHGKVAFEFNGKGGKRMSLAVEDKQLTRLVNESRQLRGSALFQYLGPDGKPRPVHAADLNRYLNSISESGVTAKDLRTWNATVIAYQLLQTKPRGMTARQARSVLRETLCAVAAQLGNTPAVCRTSYVHSALQDAFLEQSLPRPPKRRMSGLSPAESAVHALLTRTARRRGKLH